MLILYDAYEKLSYSQSGQRGIEREIRDLEKQEKQILMEIKTR